MKKLKVKLLKSTEILVQSKLHCSGQHAENKAYEKVCISTSVLIPRTPLKKTKKV